MSRKFHIAISVRNLELSIAEYTKQLGSPPCLVVPDKYALWRTNSLNFSIRCAENEPTLRHLGWEDELASGFSQTVDVNEITWERFSFEQQQQEIESLWGKDILKN